ncbi:ATP-dependent RNA helicase SrmB [Paraburkholderia aspalathi]|uniref:ATP-dependent RNA helicase SrmB n=1 Tax=Paraburkholderia aspalathi TaxID=1324617 RepID=A0ABM8SBI4_9BURK|nr:DEAD/DEAH box helicase [Paraburkholderia aspalathi]MBK3821348.1 DEAD/DEAH box helicase [Paraburkholderia aspalathi]MBK3833137.1 DEAD/DEAH box helicase [Paraburkholderia aspalathi]MBK3862902.1 DEAD/DEAH box helicase [Paraburkholderia aspalathi]CAE6799654.1 ATP-dependent RNA helicase SrmB [Paraburkholderia aspalathi]
MAHRVPIYASMTSASTSTAALDERSDSSGVDPVALPTSDAASGPFTPGALDDFHPAVASWFLKTFPAPTDAQAAAWPQIRSGRSTLVAAPTGSGKTLTAFLSALDELVQQGLANGGALPDETLVVYVSPLKALSNDIRINLEVPLQGIAAELEARGLPPLDIRTAVRTGDTTQQERNALKKRAPHILVTTPESLYVLLGSDSGRRMLSTVRTVIVDEIHALAGSKRGSHLALSLERLDALCQRRLPRIGLSATQKPVSAVARFLVGGASIESDIPADCAIIDVGHIRERDLALEIPPVPLEAVMPNEVWERIYDRLAELIAMHRTTLIFVNTRRMAERAARHLTERLGKDAVAAHHGSLAKEHRFDAEQRLKRGELRVLIATASLELGIDIGDVDLVCQMGSPRAIAPFLQRVGRSGHHVGGMPKGRLFPASRDDLIECAALLDCVRRGELDALRIPRAPLDVLAQQIVAEVSSAEWSEDALFEMLRRAAPYAGLEREQYDAVLRMLAEGYTSRHGPRGAYIHRDAVSGTLRGRRGGKLVAVTSGGTIPENADYAVVLEPQAINIGTVNEDFAVESLAGDVFQLGNASYRILRIESGRVRVEDAQGQPPNIPFWLGEAPGRSDELSFGVARLREQIGRLLDGEELMTARIQRAIDWLVDALGLEEAAARQIVDYLARARAALGVLPTQNTLVMERFFDESGGTQLVIHAPFGSRVNRAWGLALRKRFCRTFNFELQAAATEDAIILSLTGSHSFVLDEVWRYLHSNSAEHLLIQALLDAPLFGVRWRWNATTSLGLPRYTGGRKTPPQLQRMRSEDLLASVFPEQAACLENIVGERELPHHPLVDQTVDDCLHDAMDSESWIALLRRIERGEVQLIARDLPAPSPLAAEILTAKPYAYLDDAPIEERRTQAVQNRRWTDPSSADDLGALDADAIDSVRDEAWPQARTADEMHEALTGLACITEAEARNIEAWPAWLASLAESGRATRLRIAAEDALWLPAERLTCFQALYPDARFEPALTAPKGYTDSWSTDDALLDVLRARLTGFGPLPVRAIAQALNLPTASVEHTLTRLEAEGYVMRGRFSPGATEEEWCERHLLARIHRYTVKRLRREIEPVERHDFMRFLFEWQHLTPDTRSEGRDALAAVLDQMEGFQAAAGAWEEDILPARVKAYANISLDELCRAGKIVWTRLTERARGTAGPVRSTPIVLLPRAQVRVWRALIDPSKQPELSARAQSVHDTLSQRGAMFFDELLAEVHGLRMELENALGELVAAGLVNSDSFAGLRALLKPVAKRSAYSSSRRVRSSALIGGMDDAGRWALVSRQPVVVTSEASPARRQQFAPEVLEHVAMTLLRRYGVVFWRLLEREAEWLPPWRDLLRVFQRLEARGVIRGGRFVNGLAGEQFALPEAIPILREVRRHANDGAFVCVAGTDPLNLAGTLLVGERVPAVAGNRVLYRDGIVIATLVAGTFWFDPAVETIPTEREHARSALVRRF